MKLMYNHSIFFLFITLLIIRPTLASMNNLGKLISISSTNQVLNLQNNVAIFTGNVVITKDSIKIMAEEVIVIRSSRNEKKSTIEAFGNPVNFCELKDDGTPKIKGQAKKIYYEMEKGFIELVGNAYIEQINSNMKGNRIIYLVKEKKIEAFGDDKNKQRVTTIFFPSQLQIKSN